MCRLDLGAIGPDVAEDGERLTGDLPGWIASGAPLPAPPDEGRRQRAPVPSAFGAHRRRGLAGGDLHRVPDR